MKFNSKPAATNRKYTWIDVRQDDPKYGGIPNGTHQFICLWGNIGLTGETDTYGAEQFNAECEADNTFIDTVTLCQLINKDSQDNKYLKWHYSGKEDPMVKMGYVNERNYATKRTPEVVNRLVKVTGQSPSFCTNNTEFYNTKVHLPFAQVDVDAKGKVDFGSIKYVMIGISLGQAANIVSSFAALEGQKSQTNPGAFNPNPFGYLVKLVKNKKAADKKQCYMWSVKPSAWYGDSPALLVELPELYKWNNERLQGILQTGNGGESDVPENVWNYLMTMTGLKTVEAVDAKFNIRISDNFVETSSVSFAPQAELEAELNAVFDSDE